MANNMILLVLAAGMGSRYGGIKQIDGFGPSGETIMDYSLFDAARNGFNKVVFIVRDEIKDTVSEMFLPKLKNKMQVEFVLQSLRSLMPAGYQNSERTKPWGTAHAMLCAKDVIKEPFAVINADDFYGNEAFRAVAAFFKENKDDHAMVGYTLKHVLSDYGSVSRGCGETDAKGYLTSVVERVTINKVGDKIISTEKTGDVEISPETPTSMNFWGFQPSIFNVMMPMFESFIKEKIADLKAEFFIPLPVNEMIRKQLGRVKVINGGSTWFGVTYKEDKSHVAKKISDLVKQGIYPARLWV